MTAASDIFLSYNREDAVTARRFAEGLEREGFSVWWDQTLRSGQAYDEVTEHALHGAKAVVVLWSPRSVVSRWVRSEATVADRNKTLVPVMIEPCDLPIMFELTQTADMGHWHGAADDPAWQAFVGDVKQIIQRGRAIFGRKGHMADCRIGRLTLQPRRQLLDGDRRIAIGRKTLDLLSVLAEADGEIVTKDELVGPVWSGALAEKKAIQAHMSAVRKVLGGEAGRLVTVRGVGYRLDVAEKPEHRVRETETLPFAIAVLPFINLTGDASKEYLADGMAEELITTLSRSSGIKVSARTSTFAYKGRNTDVRQIARDLGVSVVLDGSIRKSGHRLRVAAQLIEASTGFHLWAQSYDRSDHDLLTLQGELAAAIADVLKVKLGIRATVPRNPEAVRLYSQGRALAGRVSTPALLKAIDLQEQALKIDPSFARGRVGLAGTLMVAAANGAIPLGRMADALDHLNEAIRLDPGDSAPYGIRAAMDAVAGRWVDAEVGFRAASERHRDEPTALNAYAYQLLAPCGHLRRSLETSSTAVGLAPASTAIRIVCAHLALACGENGLARQHFEMAELLGIDPDQPGSLILQAELARLDGRIAEAIALMTKVMQPMGTPNLANTISLVHAAQAGHEDKSLAAAAVNRLIMAIDSKDVRWSRGHLVSVLLCWLVALGAIDEAYALVDHITELWHHSRFLAPPFLRQMWRFDMQSFRDDMRFQRVVKRFGMFGYWERYGAPDGYAIVRQRLSHLT